MYSVVAIAGLVLGAWVTLGRFNQPLSAYSIVTLVGLIYGFLVVWVGAYQRGIAIGGFVGIFVVFWFLSASQRDLGILQYGWILSSLAGGVFARKEFPWTARRNVREQRKRPDGLFLLSGGLKRGRRVIDEDEALSLVRGLDGDTRTVVSVERYGARLDMCGSAATGLIAFFNSQPDDLNSWSQVASTGQEGQKVEVRIGKIDVEFDIRELIDFDSASDILRSFAQTGEADSRFVWVTSPSVNDRRVLPN
jgi:hypothetical protein